MLVRHEPRASITGAEVKFSDAMSSMPRLCSGRWERGGKVRGGKKRREWEPIGACYVGARGNPGGVCAHI